MSTGLFIKGYELTEADVARFWSHVDTSGGPDACWPWKKCTYVGGYGKFRAGRKDLPAHRLALLVTSGRLPRCALHACDNPPCCNPSHLFDGTMADNNRDCAAKGRHSRTIRTHCPLGHPYDEANTIKQRNGRGRVARRCRTCRSRRALR